MVSGNLVIFQEPWVGFSKTLGGIFQILGGHSLKTCFTEKKAVTELFNKLLIISINELYFFYTYSLFHKRLPKASLEMH